MFKHFNGFEYCDTAIITANWHIHIENSKTKTTFQLIVFFNYLDIFGRKNYNEVLNSE